MDKKWITKNCIIYHVLKGRSNSFLVNFRDNYLLIDTGRKNSWKKLTRKLDKILGDNKLNFLILTHTHFDHVENAAMMKEKYKSQIIVHKSESDYLKHGDTPLPKGTNFATGFIVDVLGKRVQSIYKYGPASPDILVDEKYDLSHFGSDTHIIHTPGHSKGSMSIIIDNEIAVVGDAMFGVFGNSIYPPFVDNPEIMVESWKILLDTDCKLFLPGHGRVIRRELLEEQYEKHKSGIKK